MAFRFETPLEIQQRSHRHSRIPATRRNGPLDFTLAHEPTLMAFAGAAGLDPVEVQAARQKLDAGR